jgi:tRNA threonylcarbamoyladenosine biosynthesis protein TsaB
VGCGDGFAIYRDRLPDFSRLRADVAPTAAAVARLAAPRFACGEGIDAAQAVPLYVRDKVALTTAERLARGGVR